MLRSPQWSGDRSCRHFSASESRARGTEDAIAHVYRRIIGRKTPNRPLDDLRRHGSVRRRHGLQGAETTAAQVAARRTLAIRQLAGAALVAIGAIAMVRAMGELSLRDGNRSRRASLSHCRPDRNRGQAKSGGQKEASKRRVWLTCHLIPKRVAEHSLGDKQLSRSTALASYWRQNDGGTERLALDSISLRNDARHGSDRGRA